jgi:hypothetical protein
MAQVIRVPALQVQSPEFKKQTTKISSQKPPGEGHAVVGIVSVKPLKQELAAHVREKERRKHEEYPGNSCRKFRGKGLRGWV